MSGEDMQHDEVTILVHGFSKSYRDMMFLSNGLDRRQRKNIVVHLPTTLSRLEDCVDSLRFQIADPVKEYRVVHFVAHSMGGLIVRSYLNRSNLENIGKCVFIATPHKGSKLAEVVGAIPFVRNIFKPVIDLHPSKQNNYLLKNRKIKIGLIVGNRNRSMFGKIFLSKESDGRVEMDSALSDDATDIITLNYGHQQIHHREETLQLVIDFLSNGSFTPSTAETPANENNGEKNEGRDGI